VRKAAKVLTPTFTAPMPISRPRQVCAPKTMTENARQSGRGKGLCTRRRRAREGFTITEAVVVIVMVSLFVLIAVPNLFGTLRRNSFKSQVQDFVSAMQMAVNAAAESDRRYEVIIDFVEQSYLLREITTPDLSQVLEEEIITQRDFGDNCRVWYVLFDDGEYSDQSRVKFRAGHSGWSYGGKIVLLDEADQPYSVVVNRLNRIVELVEGDAEILPPKSQDDIPY